MSNTIFDKSYVNSLTNGHYAAAIKVLATPE